MVTNGGKEIGWMAPALTAVAGRRRAADLLAARTPPSLTTTLKALIEAEERRVRSIQYHTNGPRN